PRARVAGRVLVRTGSIIRIAEGRVGRRSVACTPREFARTAAGPLPPSVRRGARARCMHILMIAPEPFFEPRGTPFSEFHRIRALTALGHEVDLVTYPFGGDVSMAGLRIFRCLRPPFMRGVGIGPSLVKVPLDALLALTVVRRALTRRYDAIHSHEEGAA